MESLPQDTTEPTEEIPNVENQEPKALEGSPEGAPEGNQEEAPRKKGIPAHKRINQLVGQGHEKDRRIQELESKVAEQEKANIVERPDLNDYEDSPQDYLKHQEKFNAQEAKRIKREAIEDYEIEQEQKKAARNQRKIYENYGDSRNEAVRKYKDYEKSESEVNQIINDFRANGLQELILQCDDPAAIIDYYGRNPQNFEDLSQSYLSSPQGAARILGRQETKLERKPAKTKEAPAPLPKGGNSKGKVGFDPYTATQEEYNRHYNNK